MNRMRLWAWLGAALLVLPYACGCGGAMPAKAEMSGGAAPPMQPAASPAMAPGVAVDGREMVAMAPPPPPPIPGGGSAPAAPKVVSDSPHSAAMLIYTANLALAVFQVGQGLDAVEHIGRDVGGYLSVRQDNLITIRVPRDKFDDAIARIEKLGDVTHRDIKAQDVTDEFVDLSARLKNAYVMRDRLQELLAKATVKEALDIEKELGRITEEIERLEGRLKLLRDQIAFSTITVTFAPMAEQSVHDSSLLAPFPWLQDLGLSQLLNVH